MKGITPIKRLPYVLLFVCLQSSSWVAWAGGWKEHEFIKACRIGNTAAVRYFINKNDIDINGLYPPGGFGLDTTCLLTAVWHRQLNVVKALLKAGVDINKSVRGFSALYLAVADDHYDLTMLLLGAKPNFQLIDNNHALIYAAHEGKTDYVELLLNYGADPDAQAVGYLYNDTPKRATYEGQVQNVSKWTDYANVRNLLARAQDRKAAAVVRTQTPAVTTTVPGGSLWGSALSLLGIQRAAVKEKQN